MRFTSSIVAVGLVPILALAGCDEPAAGPVLEATNAAYNVASADPPGKAGPEFPGPRGPAEILELSDELGLSQEQYSAIEAIVLELEELNAPLWEEVRSDRRGTARSPRGDLAPLIDRSDPTMQQIRENTRAAMRAALALLTDAQRRLFMELRDRPEEGRFPGVTPPQGFQPGSIVLDAADELGLTAARMAELRTILHERTSRGPESWTP